MAPLGGGGPNPGARPATAADLGELVRLGRESQADMAAGRGGHLWLEHQGLPEPLADHLMALMADPAAQAWVGSLDGHVVGWSRAHVEDLASGVTLGTIDALFVEEAARGVGVGEAMMEAMMGWFDRRACVGVDAMALPGSRAAKGFLESAGFKARLLVMHRSR